MSGFPLHPGGQSHTLRLLQQAEKAGLAPGAARRAERGFSPRSVSGGPL